MPFIIYQETKKPRNYEIKRLRNQDIKAQVYDYASFADSRTRKDDENNVKSVTLPSVLLA